MRPRYSFSSRRTRRTKNIRKQKTKFPKAVDILIKEADIILLVLDARLIEETRNKEIEDKIKKFDKKLIYVITKADLVDKDKLDKYKKILKPSVYISSTKYYGITQAYGINAEFPGSAYIYMTY